MTCPNVRTFALLGLVISGLGCADFKAMSGLANALHDEYGVAVGVNVSNDTELTITFPQDAIDRLKLDSAGTEEFARTVATFAKAHYAKSAGLAHIRVASVQSTRVGALKMTRTGGPYSFAVGELHDR
jgi:hypothetical protein